MRISIVIATFNRGEKLRRTLQSLAGQTVAPSEWEAVAVDNNSSDNTAEVFAEFAAAHPFLNLKMVAEPRQGLSWARNRGIAEARGDIIAIIDDDEEAGPEFVAAYLDFFARHPSAAMAGGRVVPVYETGRPRWMSRWTERPIAGTLDLGPREKPFTRGYPAGGNLAVKRWVIERYGAFDTSLGRTGTSLVGGEEKEFFVRVTTALASAGGSAVGGSSADADGVARRGEAAVWWTPGPTIHHIIPAEKLTVDYFRRLSCGVGRSEKMRVTGASKCYLSVSEREEKRTSGRGFGAVRLAIALAKEALKWIVTLILAAWFVLTLRPSRARYLIMMRVGISRGLLGL